MKLQRKQEPVQKPQPVLVRRVAEMQEHLQNRNQKEKQNLLEIKKRMVKAKQQQVHRLYIKCISYFIMKKWILEPIYTIPYRGEKESRIRPHLDCENKCLNSFCFTMRTSFGSSGTLLMTIKLNQILNVKRYQKTKV